MSSKLKLKKQYLTVTFSGWSADELSVDVARLDVICVSTDDELVVGGAVVSLDADNEWLYVLLESI